MPDKTLKRNYIINYITWQDKKKSMGKISAKLDLGMYEDKPLKILTPHWRGKDSVK